MKVTEINGNSRTPPPWRVRLRGVGLISLAAVGLVVLTQLLGLTQPGGGGMPAAILFAGLVQGMVTALTAVGLVLIYRTTRIINFAQTAIGAAGAALCFELLQLTSIPFPVAFVLGLLCAGALGLLFDLVFGRRFFRAPRLVLTVLTIVVAELLGERAVDTIRRLPIFPPTGTRSITELSGTQPLQSYLPFPSFRFQIGNFALPFGFSELFALGASAALLIAIVVLLRYTRFGTAVRAMAENAERASLLGISVGVLSSLVWAASGVISGASVTLAGLLSNPASALGFAPEVLLPALAAAIIGRMRGIAVTAFAAVAISVLQNALLYVHWDQALLDVALFAVVGFGLLFQARGRERSDAAVATSWQATEEVRPIPSQLMAVPSVRAGRYGLIAVLALTVVIVPFVASVDVINLGGVIALDAVVGLSLVVLTGWAGQVSLGQFGFVALGAVFAGGFATHYGVPFWVAVPLATILTAGVATLVGISALRIQGLFLGATTFAFAVAVQSALFSQQLFGWLLPGPLSRPSLFLVDFNDERSMYFLCLACLALVIIVLVNLRHSRFGRTLIAVRDNENDAASNGLSPARTKLIAFALAGGLAGFAGAVFAFQQRGVSAGSFTVTASVTVFISVVLGGVSTIAGALIGSAYINATTYLVGDSPFASLFGPGGTLLLLYVAPGGLISLLARLRDAWLRIVAQRHQLIVPSLFADVDPEALSARLAPLARAPEASVANSRRRYGLPGSLISRGSSVYGRGPSGILRPAARGDVDAAAHTAVASVLETAPTEVRA